jgi:hypothetical protein
MQVPSRDESDEANVVDGHAQYGGNIAPFWNRVGAWSARHPHTILLVEVMSWLRLNVHFLRVPEAARTV